jgi:hypothetical protein
MLQRLSLQWFGKMDSMAWVLPLRDLRMLDLDAHTLCMDVPLTSLTQLTGLAVSGRGGAAPCFA